MREKGTRMGDMMEDIDWGMVWTENQSQRGDMIPEEVLDIGGEVWWEKEEGEEAKPGQG